MCPQNSAIPIDEMTLGHITKVDGAQNMGGMTTKGYIFLDSHIEAWPAPKTVGAGSGPEDLVELEGNVTMVAGKYAIEVTCVIDKSSLQFDNQGEPEGQSFHPVAKFSLPGATIPAKMGWAQILNNTLGAFCFIDNYGNRIWFGDENRQASFKPSGNTGAKPADFSEISYEVSWDSFSPAKIYYGAIPLSVSEIVPAVES